MSKTPYGVITHNTVVKQSSFIAKVDLIKADPVEISAVDVNTVVKCGANSDMFLGVANENKLAGGMLGIDEAEYFVGLVGTAGVSLGDAVKTDGAGGFILGTTAGDNQVAIAMTAGVAGDYIEFKKLPVVRVVPTV